MIEFTHRVTSGISLLMVIGLVVWAVKAYPKGHSVRLGATLSLIFIIIESLLGAGLVLFELVADNVSMTRAVVMAIHLVNTFLLLGVITLTAWAASTEKPIRWWGAGWLGGAMWLGFAGILLLGASGGVTALGDTLFPATSLAEGLQEKFSPTANFLVRLRLYHPLIAIGVGLYLMALVAIHSFLRATPTTRQLALVLIGTYLLQLGLGVLNVLLLAPVWMQLVHLFVSDVILIVYVLFIAEAFVSARVEAESRSPSFPQQGQEVYG